MKDKKAAFQEALKTYDGFLNFLRNEVRSEEYQQAKKRVEAGPHPTEDMLYDYVQDWMDEYDARIIRKHTLFCKMCADKVLKIRLFEEELEDGSLQPFSEIFFRKYANAPLPVSSVSDRHDLDLTDEYFGRLKYERLAASAGKTGEIAFPFTVSYADGKIIGQFQKFGWRLCYLLKSSPIDPEKFVCLLKYTPASDPENVKLLELQQGERVTVGQFKDIVSSSTIQGMADALQQFQLLLKRKETK